MPIPAGGDTPPGSYASIQDLTDAISPRPAPANAAQLLIRASRDVDRALLCTVYDPTDPAVVAALNEATVEQAAANLDNGNLTGNGGGQRRGFTLGRLAVQASSADDKPVKIGPLWEQAWDVLQQAGLTGHGPQSR